MITIYGNDCPDGCEVIYDGYELRWNTETNNELKLTAIKLSQSIFELIEDNNIDIDSIEELDDACYDVNIMSDDDLEFYHNKTRTTINEILQAVKQIDKRVKKLEEK